MYRITSLGVAYRPVHSKKSSQVKKVKKFILQYTDLFRIGEFSIRYKSVETGRFVFVKCKGIIEYRERQTLFLPIVVPCLLTHVVPFFLTP